MFGGIGPRGGKKDRKQTRKNIKEKSKQIKQLEKEKGLRQKKERQKQKRLEEMIRKESIPSTSEKRERKEKAVDLDETKTKNEMVQKLGVPEEKKLIEINNIEIKPKQKKNISPLLDEKNKPVQEDDYLEDIVTILNKLEEPTKKKSEPISLEPPLPMTRNFEEEKSEKKEEEISQFHYEEKDKVAINKEEKNKEKEEDILEFKIATELEGLLKKNRYELKKLYTELEELEKESTYLYKVEDIEDALDEIERLLAYLEQIKRQLEVISNSYHIDDLYALDDSYFTDLVKEYKDYIKDQKTMDQKVKDLKRNEEYTSLIKKILEFEQMQEELAQTLEEKKKELEERDYQLAEIQNQSLDIERINQDLENLIQDSEKYLEEIQNKVNESLEITKKTEIKMHYTMGVLARTLLLFSLLRMNPKPKANAVTAVETLVAIDLINKLLTPKKEKRTVTEYYYQNYRSMIENALGNMDSIFYLIRNGIIEIQELKETLKEDWKQYEDVLPEYKELFQSIEKIEKELLEREENMNRIKEDMELQLEKNNQKVLEYENLNMENN